MNYECHITVDTKYAALAKDVAKALHWKTSEIARDPVLGDKNFFYLTTHASTEGVIRYRMRECSKHLQCFDVPVLREKIELIIHDTRGKV